MKLALDMENVSDRTNVIVIEVGGESSALTRHHQKHAGVFHGPTTRGCVPDMDGASRTISVGAHQVGGDKIVNTMDHLLFVMTGFTLIRRSAVDMENVLNTMGVSATRVGTGLSVVTKHPRSPVGIFRMTIRLLAVDTELASEITNVNVKPDTVDELEIVVCSRLTTRVVDGPRTTKIRAPVTVSASVQTSVFVTRDGTDNTVLTKHPRLHAGSYHPLTTMFVVDKEGVSGITSVNVTTVGVGDNVVS